MKLKKLFICSFILFAPSLVLGDCKFFGNKAVIKDHNSKAVYKEFTDSSPRESSFFLPFQGKCKGYKLLEVQVLQKVGPMGDFGDMESDEDHSDHGEVSPEARWRKKPVFSGTKAASFSGDGVTVKTFNMKPLLKDIPGEPLPVKITAKTNRVWGVKFILNFVSPDGKNVKVEQKFDSPLIH